MKPIRVQRTRMKNWEMPPNTVYVGRPSKWGNPFNLQSAAHCWTAIAHGFKGNAKGRRLASVAMFAGWICSGKSANVEGCGLYADPDGDKFPVSVSPPLEAGPPPSITDIRAELSGKNLACWCPLDQPCHADILLKIANRDSP